MREVSAGTVGLEDLILVKVTVPIYTTEGTDVDAGT